MTKNKKQKEKEIKIEGSSEKKLESTIKGMLIKFK